jgi:CspA family cold shock protein
VRAAAPTVGGAVFKKAFVRERRVDMASGTVKWFNSAKGYGFIQPEEGGKDVFVHVSAVERAGLRGLNEGQKIEYELQDERGRTAAVNLRAP